MTARRRAARGRERRSEAPPARLDLLALLALTALLALILAAGGCTVGPAYHKPDVDTPGSYKENGGGTGAAAPAGNGPAVTKAPAPVTPVSPNTPASGPAPDAAAVSTAPAKPAGPPPGSAVWQVAQPGDNPAARGKWWESFGDPQLNQLEEQIDTGNQSLAAAYASFQQARALVLQARAQLFPTASTAPSVTYQRQPSANAAAQGAVAGSSRAVTEYNLPFDASWTPDLWGRVRNTVRGQVSSAQAQAADLANTRLTLEAELAVDYYQLRGQDTLRQLLDSTVVAYKQSLDLTRALYETGIDSDESVAQAETQLEATEAQATNLDIARQNFEHAIALLIGKPPASFSLPRSPLTTGPPAVPPDMPSALLERRPDIAATERLMEQANAQIGVAQAAYFPNLTLSGSAGFASTALSSWLTWPSRFWSVGASLAETLFDAGLRRATVLQFRAAYDQAVANYRQTVLTAFQQVEDNLGTVRVLALEVQQQDAAVKSAQRQLALATDRYRLGIDPYLNVITAQTTVLANEQTAVNLSLQQMTATVQLIEALGGGWDGSQLPTAADLVANRDGGVHAPQSAQPAPSASGGNSSSSDKKPGSDKP